VFATFTRPDGSPVAVNINEVVRFAPVPATGPTSGPLKDGTRLSLKNGENQDVKERQDEVMKRLGG
jgi:hypothetical protein